MNSQCRSSIIRTALAILPLAGVWALPVADGAADEASPPSSLVRYTTPAGDAYFAVSLSAPNLPLRSAGSVRNYVMLVDTSASQAGQHRRQVLRVIDGFLSRLHAEDRIHLLAVDVEQTDLTDGFVSPRSEEFQFALRKLRQRVPLGATCLLPALEAASKEIAGVRPHAIVYLGDGMSTGELIDAAVLRRLTGRLRRHQIPVNGYAVGPRTDLELLGILAEQTGGLLLPDELVNDEQEPAELLGERLAAAMAVTLFYPERMIVEPPVDGLLPSPPPPVRPDRETVVLGQGRLPLVIRVTMQGRLNGAAITRQWTVSSDAVPANNSFLAGLWAIAERDQGLSVAVAGTPLLNLARRAHEDRVQELILAGHRALAVRDLALAEQIVLAIGQLDPGNTDTVALKRAVQKRQRDFKSAAAAAPPPEASDSQPVDPNRPATPAGTPPKPLSTVPAADADDGAACGAKCGADSAADDDKDAPPEPPPAPGVRRPGALRPGDAAAPADATGTIRKSSLLLREQEGRVLRAQEFSRRIVATIALADEESDTDPDGAIGELKRAMNLLDQSPDLDADTRVSLRSRLLAAMRRITSREVQIDSARVAAAEKAARQAAERRNASSAVERSQQIEQLLERTRLLLEEGQRGREQAFADAQAVSRSASLRAPYSGEATASLLAAQTMSSVDRMQRLRDVKAGRFLDTLHQVELAHVPFPDSSPIAYPPADEWRALTERRRKRFAVDLYRASPGEQRIRKTLDAPTDVDFIEMPLKDALRYLQDLHGINIWLNSARIADEGVSTDQPITLQLTGVRFRSALKLMLEPLALSYVVDDDILKITTAVDASEAISTRVYPIGDLVVPIPQVTAPGFGRGVGGAGGIRPGGRFGAGRN